MGPMSPAGEYEAGRPTRGAASPGRRAGETRISVRRRDVPPLDERGDAVLRERADALGGGDADLHRILDAGDLPGDHVVATRRVTLDGVAVAAHDALETGACLLDVALHRVAGLHATTLVATLKLLELALGGLRGAEGVGERAGRLDHAVARLEGQAHVGQRRALGERHALLGGGAGGTDVGLGGRTRLVACLRAHAPARGLR